MIDFEFVKKNDDHVKVLYDLLLSRDEAQNISHQSKPDFEEHQEFVMNHPYRAWYLVKKDGRYIGSVNILDNNAIGLYIPTSEEDAICSAIEFIKNNHEPLPAIKSVRPEKFIVNVAMANKKLEKIISNIGAQAVQTTYLV